MKAAILTINGFEIREIQTPNIGDNEVLARTLVCGVCNGEVFVYQKRAELASANNRLGHEASGKIVAVGRSVTNVQPGDIITALAQPAYAVYFVADSEMVVKIPPEIDPAYALDEPIACCVHAANRFGTRLKDKAAIIGCGFMGLVSLQMVKNQGAGFICPIEPVSERRDLSVRLGADIAYNPNEKSTTDILKLHSNFNIVIEAAGTQSAINLCTNLVDQHGRIILIGYHQSNNGLRTVNMQQWNYKAIDVINGHVHRDDEKTQAMRKGMELMQRGYLNTKPLVSFYDFAEIELAFRNLTESKSGLLKAVLLM